MNVGIQEGELGVRQWHYGVPRAWLSACCISACVKYAAYLCAKEAFFLNWLELFRRIGPEMAPQTE
jgi:hypothetical protein